MLHCDFLKRVDIIRGRRLYTYDCSYWGKRSHVLLAILKNKSEHKKSMRKWTTWKPYKVLMNAQHYIFLWLQSFSIKIGKEKKVILWIPSTNNWQSISIHSIYVCDAISRPVNSNFLMNQLECKSEVKKAQTLNHWTTKQMIQIKQLIALFTL